MVIMSLQASESSLVCVMTVSLMAGRLKWPVTVKMRQCVTPMKNMCIMLTWLAAVA